jgi:hypothetical protein
MTNYTITDIVLKTVQTVPAVLPYLSDEARLFVQLHTPRAMKAEGGNLGAINKEYHDAVTAALLAYLEGGSVTGPRNSFRRAMVEAFGSAADMGWTEGGGSLPFDGEALEWFNARVEAEMGFVNMLFQQAKELRGQEDFDALAWASERADGYTNTLKEVYNNLRLRVMDNIMVTFDGDDGATPCDTCKKLKGKRHKLSWFISRGYIPPHGSGLDCSKGGHCQHGLRKDNGDWVTI